MSQSIAQPAELTRHRAPLPALTGIRFLAAFYVVLFHSKLAEILSAHHLFSFQHLIENGQIAVSLFFILSGFILSYTYESQIELQHGKRRFWEARFARIWPLYAVSLFLSSLIMHRTPTWPNAIATVFMVQAWNPVNIGMAASWNTVCWTLSTEALFYLIFPFAQVWLERSSAKVRLAVLGIAFVVSVVFGTSSTSYSDVHGFKYIPLAVLHIPEFLAGVCAGNLFLDRRADMRRRSYSGPMLPGRGIWTWAAAALSLFLLFHAQRAFTSWVVVSFTVLLFGLAAETSKIQRFLSTRTLLLGGQISYGIYLLQWPCKGAVNAICSAVHINSAIGRFGLDCVALILISIAGFYCIEEPARKKIRRFFLRLDSPTDQPVSV